MTGAPRGSRVVDPAALVALAAKRGTVLTHKRRRPGEDAVGMRAALLTMFCMASVSAVAVVALVAVLAVNQAAAQEPTAETAGEAGGDILTRYDDATTQQLQAEYEDLLQEQEAYLKESPTAYFGEDEEMADRLADARFRAIQDAPLPSAPAARAEELRRKADSASALQFWAEDAGVDIDSDVYLGEAAELAETYRARAEELEAQAAEGRPDRQDSEPVSERPDSPRTETSAGGADAGNGTAGLLAAVNHLPLLVFAALVGIVAFALYRSPAGAGVSGLFARAFQPALAEFSKRSSPRSAPKPTPKKEIVPEGSGPKPEGTTPEREPGRGPEPDDEPPPDYADPAKFAEWFEEAMREPDPDADRGDEQPDDEEPPD